jgi:hypothetical protein
VGAGAPIMRAVMTVGTTPAATLVTVSGTTPTTAIPFRFESGADLVVHTRPTGGAWSAKSLGVDFTVAGGATDAGGTLTWTPALTLAGEVRVVRRTTKTQGARWKDVEKFPALSVEAALDRLTLNAQEIDALAQRGIVAPLGEAGLEIQSIADRANKFFTFDGAGAPKMITFAETQVTGTMAIAAAFTKAGANISITFNPGTNELAIAAVGVAQAVHGHNVVDAMNAGFMSVADKAKLDSYGTSPGLSDLAPQPLGVAAAGASLAASRSDHVHNMPSAADVGAAAAGHGHADATTMAAGFMSAADKSKLDGLPAGLGIDDAIANGETARAPSQNAVFDALALKGDLTRVKRAGLTLSDYGYTGSGTATAAFNSALADAIAQTFGTNVIHLPAGTIDFNTKPNDLSGAVIVRGCAINGTTIRRNYTQSGVDIGCLEVTGSGVVLENFAVWGGATFTGGSAIRVKAPTNTPIGSIILRNLYLTPNAGAFGKLLIWDGTAAAGGGGTALGVRSCLMEQVDVFGANGGHSVEFRGAEAIAWIGGGCYPAGGTHANAGRILITGTSTVKTTDIRLDISDAQGIDLDWVDGYDIRVASGISLTNANASGAPETAARTDNTGFGRMVDARALAYDNFRNLIVNGGFSINEPLRSSVADGAYCTNRMYVLTQSGNIAYSRVSAPRQGSPFCGRFTQSQGSAQRFGVAQLCRSANVSHLRQQIVSMSALLRLSAAGNLRCAILEWTGGTDVPTKDFVNNWASTTYTPGNFFVASNWSVLACGVVAGGANIWAPIHIPASVSNSMANLAVFVWTEAAQAQNVTLDVTDWQLERGSLPSPFEHSPKDFQLERCRPYYWKSFPESAAPAQNAGFTGSIVFTQAVAAGVGQWNYFQPPTEMFAIPNATLYNPSAANAQMRGVDSAADCTGTVVGNWGANGLCIYANAPAGGVAGQRLATQLELEAEIGV